MKLQALLTGLALVASLAGCAVVTVADATVGAVASVAGLAVDATVGTARLAGRAVSAVVPGGSD